MPLLAACAWLAVAPARADDWPQWRGPAGVGVSGERDLPERWSAGENVAWRARLPGAGVSSPVVAGGQVFVTSQAGRGARREGNHPSLVQGADAASAGERTLGGDASRDGSVVFVVSAYRTSDGRETWRYELPAEGPLAPVHDKHNLASPSPVTDGRLVFAWFGTGQVVALDTGGRLAWKRHLGAEISPFTINWGHASSPALHGDLLILLCYHEPASYLLALDKQTGKVRWRVDRGREIQSYSTPVVVRSERGDELIVNSSEGLEAYDPSTGEALWRTPETNRFPIPVPVHHEGTLYTSRGYRSGPYMALRLGGRGDVSATHVRWKVPTGAPYVSSLVHYEGLLYMASELGIVTCIDAATGERVWRERLGGIYTASPVAGDGKVYLVSETGEVIVLRAGRKPEVIARNTLPDHLVASPAIAGGRIFLRGDDQLIAVGR
jgi:outer membrane protein assembly factor BamB